MAWGRKHYIDRAALEALAAARAAESQPVIASGRALEAQGKLEEAIVGIDAAIEEGQAKGEPCKELRFEKIRLLRRLRRPQDAIAAAYQLMDACKMDVYRLIYETYLQFNLVNEAAAHIKEWKKARKKPWEDEEFTVENRNLMWARVHQETFQQNFRVAELSLFDKFTEIGGTDVGNERIILQSVHGTWRAERKLRARQLKDALWEPDNHERLTRAYANMAINGWHMGNEAVWKENAEKALAECTMALENSTANAAMLYTLKSLMLALQNRMDEARATQTAQKELAPCSFCAYNNCKAAALLEVRLTCVESNWQQAFDLCEAGLAEWPDEMAFIVERGFAASHMPKQAKTDSAES